VLFAVFGASFSGGVGVIFVTGRKRQGVVALGGEPGVKFRPVVVVFEMFGEFAVGAVGWIALRWIECG
jgi:hypothetical protein